MGFAREKGGRNRDTGGRGCSPCRSLELGERDERTLARVKGSQRARSSTERWSQIVPNIRRTTGAGVAPFLGLTSLTRGSHPYPGEKEWTVAKERNVKEVHAGSDVLAGQRTRVESRAQKTRAHRHEMARNEGADYKVRK